MVNVQVGVEDPPDVGLVQPMPGELLVEPLVAAVETLHPEVAHDLGAAKAGVDQNRRLAAQDQEAEHRHLNAEAAVVPKHEEARLKLDVAQVEHLDLNAHTRSYSSRREQA